MDAGEIFAGVAAAGAALFLVVAPAVCLSKAIASDGKVAYCYVETYIYHTPAQADSVLYDLVGFRPWRSDRRMAQNLRTLEDVQTAAQRLNCVLK